MIPTSPTFRALPITKGHSRTMAQNLISTAHLRTPQPLMITQYLAQQILKAPCRPHKRSSKLRIDSCKMGIFIHILYFITTTSDHYTSPSKHKMDFITKDKALKLS